MHENASEEFELEVPELDHEHALQVQLVKAIRRALMASDRITALELMHQLDDVTHAHFTAEQILMRQNAYPSYRAHEAEHNRLLEDLRRLRRSMAERQHEASSANATAIESWLLDHIRTADRAFSLFLRNSADM